MLGQVETTSAVAAQVPRARHAGRALSLAALFAFSAGLLVWRLWCIGLGPDPDTDAYGHFVIARLLLETPLNLRIHWVWLPLYHALLALPVALGATLDHVRAGNALLAVLPPFLLLQALRRRHLLIGPDATAADAAGTDAAVPYVASALAAASPLFVEMGTTGQMEVWFSVLVVLAAALLARERYGWAALALGAAALTRYEGWAVAAVVAAELARRRLLRAERWTGGELACVLGPAMSVLGWALARRLGGEPWFGFILDNQAFAERVLEHGAADRLLAITRYVSVAPYRAFGVCAPLALLGLRRTWRREGVWWVAPGLAILAFLTLSALSRSHLGLDRHFVSAIPFVATWMAHGLAALAGGAARALRRPAAARVCFAAFGALAAWGALARLEGGLAPWSVATRSALPEVRRLAEFLQALPGAALVVCDDAVVEVLSELEPARFVRTRPDARFETRLRELAASGDVYIVSRVRQLHGYVPAGRVSYGELDGPPEAFVAIRVAAGAPPVNAQD